MTNLFLIISILVWPFGQLLQLTPFTSPLRLQLLDVISALLFLNLLIFSRQKVIWDPLFKPLAIFSLVALLSFGNTAYLLRFVSYTSFYFAFRIEGVKKYSRYLLVAAAFFLVIGFLQYFFLPDVRFLRYLGFDDHYFRLVGPLLDPNFTGLVLVILILFAPKFFSLAPLLALGLTFSRASFLSLAVGLLYLRGRYQTLLVLLLLGFVLYLIPKPFGEGVNLFRTFSIVSRFENQTKAVEIFLKNPILGVGFKSLRVDNSFLYVLATTGIIGFTTFLFFLKKAWRYSTNPLAKAAILAILVHSLFNNSFFYPPILVLFFLLLNFPIKKSA